MKITKKTVDAMAVGDVIRDEELQGFRARRLPSGKVTFLFRYTHKPTGVRREASLGIYGNVTPDEARASAKQYAGLAAGRVDPVAEQKVAMARSTNTVNHVLDKWLGAKRDLRSVDEIARMFDRHVRPAIGEAVIYDLGRDQVAAMLDKIAKDAPIMANRVRAHLNAALNWHRDGDQKFITMPVPSKKRMAKETARDRVLADDEVRDLWTALDEMDASSAFPALVRTLLLTACRRDEVANMHADELAGDEWTIPAERYKTKVAHVTTLNAEIRKVLPKRNGFVFASDGFDKPFQGFSKAKGLLDEKLAEVRKRNGRKPMAPWRLHDLRRTARTGLAKLGVSRDVGEAVLGHVNGGIAGVYNRHAYQVEKAEALKRWAKHVAGIVHSTDNVVTLPARRNVRG